MASAAIEGAKLDLSELSKLIDIPDDQYKKAVELIEQMAEDHDHMKTYEFVDLCLNLARIK